MPSLSRVQHLMQYMPWGAFDAVVREQRTDRWCKGFASRQHLQAMAYAQLSGAASLRELECAFNPHQWRLGQLARGPIRRTTLADANGQRSPAPFEAAARALMQQLGRQARTQRKQMLYLLDSTTIRLCGRGFEWTQAHATRDPGLKLHVMYEAHEQHVQLHEITASNVNDIKVARKLAHRGRRDVRVRQSLLRLRLVGANTRGWRAAGDAGQDQRGAAAGAPPAHPGPGPRPHPG